jgi:hypothetical protein
MNDIRQNVKPTKLIEPYEKLLTFMVCQLLKNSHLDRFSLRASSLDLCSSATKLLLDIIGQKKGYSIYYLYKHFYLHLWNTESHTQALTFNEFCSAFVEFETMKPEILIDWLSNNLHSVDNVYFLYVYKRLCPLVYDFHLSIEVPIDPEVVVQIIS